MPAERPVPAARQVRKEYGGLRPLRLEQLSVAPGESVALVGFDQPSAQVLVDLLTGAVAADAGEVEIFGQSTADIADADSWLALLERVGILSPRAVVLESLTVEQNLAMPYSLELNPVPPEVRERVLALAADTGLEEAHLRQTVGSVTARVGVRVRLARALAFGPTLLLAEHPNAMVEAEDVQAFAAELRALLLRRAMASVVVTADPAFAELVASRVLTFDPATGVLSEKRSWRQRVSGWGR